MVIWRGLGVAALVRTMERLAGEPSSPPAFLSREEERLLSMLYVRGRDRTSPREGEG